jgi:hypothetical protein
MLITGSTSESVLKSNTWRNIMAARKSKKSIVEIVETPVITTEIIEESTSNIVSDELQIENDIIPQENIIDVEIEENNDHPEDGEFGATIMLNNEQPESVIVSETFVDIDTHEIVSEENTEQVEVTDEIVEEVVEENLTDLIEQERTELLTEKDQLMTRLVEVSNRLKELGHNEPVVGQTKKSQMLEIYKSTSSRKEFIEQVVDSGLAGKAYAATAYQSFK